MQGQLGEKLVAELVRVIAEKNSSGLLRVSRGRTIKAIFFELGAPKYAISNLAAEQLDNKLIKERLATPEQIEQAKQRAGKPHRVASALVEMGVLTDDAMRKVVRRQVMGIVLSLFEWTQGDYAFDERIRAAHDVPLDMTASDILLEGARHGAAIRQVAEAIAPLDAVVVKPDAKVIRVDAGRLIPMESYVLSRIESPIVVSEVGALSGIADEEAHRAVCALVAAGFLKLQGDQKEAAEEPVREADDSTGRLREEVARKLHFYNSADFYEILGVTRQATTADIKAAYYQLAKKFHPDRHRNTEHSDLRGKLEALLSLITQAYDTLSEPPQRAAYDERLRRSSAGAPAVARKPPPAVTAEPKAADPQPPAEEVRHTGDLRKSGPLPDKSAPSPPPSDEAVVEEAQARTAVAHAGAGANGTANGNTGQQAEHYYQQGRARYDRKEYHAAVHLLREAVKLDPTRAAYHYHLGVALIRNPRTRREAEEHLSKAAELEPYNTQVRVKLGMLYKEAGLTKKAEGYFQQALQLDPDNRAARRELTTKSAAPPAESMWKSDIGKIAKRIFKK
ncbi:MAG: DnaJ domain-containing protein [Blastocatellia bacterium]